MLLAINITSYSIIIWLVYTFRFSEQQEPIVLKNLTTVAKLLFPPNAANELSTSATISLVVRNACEIRNSPPRRIRDVDRCSEADFSADGATRDQTFGFFRGSDSRVYGYRCTQVTRYDRRMARAGERGSVTHPSINRPAERLVTRDGSISPTWTPRSSCDDDFQLPLWNCQWVWQIARPSVRQTILCAIFILLYPASFVAIIVVSWKNNW